jgi:haloalkane dehalogenase
MLICWGAQDFVFNDIFLDGFKKRFPNAEVHRFANAGHFVLEDAHEEILPLMRKFIGSNA